MTLKILPERDYQSQIETEVCPFLEQCKTSGWFDPDGKGRLYYESYLHPQAAGVLIMLHGFTESSEKYKELIFYFLQGGYQVYILDIRGHGRSVRDTGDDLSLVYIDRFETYLSDVEYLAELAMRENPGVPLYLYGHSMGGGIGAALLEKRPELFQKAVLSSPMIRPQTGGIPFSLAKLISALMVYTGKGKTYVAGQHGFQGDENFEDSAASCQERYEYYAERRNAEKLFQNSGASYSWLYEAIRLSEFVLRPKNCKRIRANILLFQAEHENFVVEKAQLLFTQRTLKTEVVPMLGTKHEIYMSNRIVLETYLQRILSFLSAEQ